jgi:hypothetical protein
MANTKISQLPSYTGTAADLRWFVMNNSGETETYKYSGYSSQIIPGNPIASIYSIYGTPASLAGTSIYSIVIGDNASALGDYATVMGKDAQASNANESRCVVYGAFSSAGQFASAVGYATSAPQQYASAFGHDAQTGEAQATSIGAQSRASGIRSVALGNFAFSFADYSVSLGPVTTSNNPRQITLGYNLTNNGGFYSTLIGGEGHTISSTGYYNTILNGSGNTISGTTSGATMLSCSGRIADADNTTYVENLRVFGQAKYGNYNNGNTASTYTINWDNGNIQKITLTGATSFSANSITDGTTYILKVQQDAVGGRTATWSSQFKWSNGTAPTLSVGANAVDIITFVAMDGVLYGVAQKNFS